MKINFEAGTNESGIGINYMVCLADRDLYAEIEVPEGASEDFGYLKLKEQIIAQAAEKGIKEPLEFWYDGQEDLLANDADGEQGETVVRTFGKEKTSLWLSAVAYAVYSDSDPLTITEIETAGTFTYNISGIIERTGLTAEQVNDALEELAEVEG